MSREIKTSIALKDIAKMLDDELTKAAGERMGFALLGFAFDETGRASYISNARREDMLKTVQQWLDRANADHSDVPAHRIN